jgi:hypothetical protein
LIVAGQLKCTAQLLIDPGFTKPNYNNRLLMNPQTKLQQQSTDTNETKATYPK